MAHLIDNVQQALNELLPAMVADGGGAELVSVEAGVVTVRLLGSCNFCPSRQLSAAALRRGLLERVPRLIDVNVVYPPIARLCNQLQVISGK